jgi:hypothetical protein
MKRLIISPGLSTLIQEANDETASTLAGQEAKRYPRPRSETQEYTPSHPISDHVHISGYRCSGSLSFRESSHGSVACTIEPTFGIPVCEIGILSLQSVHHFPRTGDTDPYNTVKHNLSPYHLG